MSFADFRFFLSPSHFQKVFSEPAHFHRVTPDRCRLPQWIAYSTECEDLFSGDVKRGLSNFTIEEKTRFFSGLDPSSYPHAFSTRYAGHQFGHFAGQLGDGRALILGDLPGQTDSSFYEIQLKGGGQTPYSRRGDGKAVLRSSLREFVASEAMFYLGVPTTRALALVGTGELVWRDMFYDGNPAEEPGAIVTRVAESFIRFGHFEMYAALQDHESLRKFYDYFVKRFYPGHDGSFFCQSVALIFKSILDKTVSLASHWHRVGFVHGVLNTDNTSPLGITIDYGPFGWLDQYDPGFTPNTTDRERRRYRFENQPSILLWNLARLAEAWSRLWEDERSQEEWLSKAEEILNRAQLECDASIRRTRQKKLGLSDEPQIDAVIASLESIMTSVRVDYYLFYRKLSDVIRFNLAPQEASRVVWEAVYEEGYEAEYVQKMKSDLERWILLYKGYLVSQGRFSEKTAQEMDAINPAFVPRNYLLQEAYEGLLRGDSGLLNQILLSAKNPYDADQIPERFLKKTPLWAFDKPGCSRLSCSS